MREILAREAQEIELGKRGENLACRVVFDISTWRKEYGEGVVQLIHQRNGDKTPYPCVVEADGGNAYWNITSADVDVAGRGHCELQYWVDEAIVKSATYITRTARSMSPASDTVPDPQQAWMDKMLWYATETEAAATVAANAETNAQSSATAASESELNAQASANAAAVSASKASASETAAKAAQKAAEEARDSASEIVGGDFASKTEAQGYANVAESNAKRYTDEKIAAIPTPDVSGQINAHNADTSAHSDIRGELAKKYSPDNKPTAADVGAAPAGYGLGTDRPQKSTDDPAVVDSWRKNGWYEYYSTTPLIPDTGISYYGAIRVDSGAYGFRQTFISRMYPQYTLCRYAANNGAWGEWEWVNPWLDAGVEYRTTERYMGKPVYVMCANVGDAVVGTSGYKSFETSARNVEKIVRVTAEANGYSLPMIIGSQSSSVFAPSISATPIGNVVKVMIGCTGHAEVTVTNIQATVWYTKTTD